MPMFLVAQKQLNVTCKPEHWDDLTDEMMDRLVDVLEDVDLVSIFDTLIEEKLPDLKHMFLVTEED